MTPKIIKAALIALALIGTETRAAAQDDEIEEAALQDTAQLYSDDAELCALLPPCVIPDSDAIQLPGGAGREMSILVSKLDSVLLLGKGRVSIIQIGGSHVQADMHTEVFRQRLDSLNGGLRPARGFLFPYSVAKTNNPLGYRVRYGGSWDKARCSVRKPRPALGVSGITVYTADTTAWISFDTDPDTTGRWTMTGLRLLSRPSAQNIKPVVDLGDTLVCAEATDDISYTFRLPRPVTHFTLRLRADSLMNPEPFFVDGVIPIAPDDGITFHTIGVNSAAVPHYLRCELFENQLRALRPDLMIMSIGVNDASGPNFNPDTFRNNYDVLIDMVRRVNPDCAFIFISNNDTKRRVRRRRRIVNTNGPLARDAFATMAEKWQGGFWDLFGLMGGLGSMSQWQKAGLAQRDCIHFSRQGYKLVGALFYNAFLNFYLDQEASDDTERL